MRSGTKLVGTSETFAERVRGGEFGLGVYLNRKVEEATAPLRGLAASDLREIKVALWELLKEDPYLCDLVQRATH